MYNGISEILDGIEDIFRGLFTGDLKTVLNGFKKIFKGVFDSLYGIVKSPINLIIRAVNSLIRGINAISIDIPDGIPGVGGTHLGFNLPQIPLLAKGTVLTRPTPVIAGEAGAEAIMPLENHTEWIDYLADKIANKIGSGGGAYIINIDSRIIKRGLAKREQELSFARNGR